MTMSWAIVIVPMTILVVGAVASFWAQQIFESLHARNYRRRAYFQDRYGYRFDAFVADNRIDRTGLAQVLQRNGPRNENATIRFIQQYEDVPTHVARRYAHYLMGEDR